MWFSTSDSFQMTTTSQEEVSFLARPFTLRSEGLFMTWLSSPKKQQSRRGLKRSDPLLFREIAQGSSMRGLLLRDVLGTSPVFSERMSEVASTGDLTCGRLGCVSISGRVDRTEMFPGTPRSICERRCRSHALSSFPRKGTSRCSRTGTRS